MKRYTLIVDKPVAGATCTAENSLMVLSQHEEFLTESFGDPSGLKVALHEQSCNIICCCIHITKNSICYSI